MRRKKFKFDDDYEEFKETPETIEDKHIQGEVEKTEVEMNGNYEEISTKEFQQNAHDWEEEKFSTVPVQQTQASILSFLDEETLLLIILFIVFTGPKKDMSLIMILLLLLLG